MDEKVFGSVQDEQASRTANSSLDVGNMQHINTVDIENFHGLHLNTVLVYLSLCLISLSQILNLIGSGAFARDIGAVIGGTSQSTWLSSIIAIITCVLGPPVSQAADYWGRKWFIVVLTAFGFIGSMIIARATSMTMAIAGEVIAGLAFGSQPLLYAVSSEVLPRQWRPIAQGGLNVAIGLAGIFTLLVGFALTQSNPAGFRTFYYIAAGVQAVSAAICVVCYKPPVRPSQSSFRNIDKLRQLDWVGFLLLTCGIVLLTIGLSWAQNPYPWDDAHVLAPFLIGVAFLIALGLNQWKARSDGMFHHDLFKKDRNYAIALLSLFVEGAVFFAANSYFVLEMSILFETKLLRAGERFMITFFASIVTSLIVAFYSSKTKKLRFVTVLAYLSFLLFHILMSTLSVGSGTAVWAYPIFLGIGLGACLTCLVTAAQLSAPPRLIAISSGLLLSVRSLGGSIALPIYSAIFNSKISSTMPHKIAAAVLPLGLPSADLPAFITALAAQDTAALTAIQGVTPAMIEAGTIGLKKAYVVSFRYVWIAAGALCAVAVITAIFLIDPDEDLNMHVDAPLEDAYND